MQQRSIINFFSSFSLVKLTSIVSACLLIGCTGSDMAIQSSSSLNSSSHNSSINDHSASNSSSLKDLVNSSSTNSSSSNPVIFSSASSISNDNYSSSEGSSSEGSSSESSSSEGSSSEGNSSESSSSEGSSSESSSSEGSSSEGSSSEGSSSEGNSSESSSSESSSSEGSSSESSSSIGPAPKTIGSIEILSGKAYEFVDENTQLIELAQGFTWAEGPVWYAKGGFLLFSDVPENIAYKWHPTEGLSRFLSPSGSTGLHFGDGPQGSNGMAINSLNELIIAQTGDRRIAKMTASLDAPSEIYETLADQYQSLRLNAPNDLTIASNGDLYFTDPTHGLPSGNQALSHQGVYRLDTAGNIKLLTDSHHQPNGIGLSPAEDMLYITDQQLYAYNLASDATLSHGRRLIRNPSQFQRPGDLGGFDGLHVHSSGTLFTSGPGGIWIVAPDGEVLAILRTGQRTANCTLSDDEKTLYITADGILVSVELKPKAN